MIGGYSLIDFKRINLTTNGSAVKIPGIYDNIEGTKKATMGCNIVLDGVEKNNRYIVFGVKNGNFVGSFGYDEDGNICTVTVTSEDMVSVVGVNSGSSNSGMAMP